MSLMSSPLAEPDLPPLPRLLPAVELRYPVTTAAQCSLPVSVKKQREIRSLKTTFFFSPFENYSLIKTARDR